MAAVAEEAVATAVAMGVVMGVVMEAAQVGELEVATGDSARAAGRGGAGGADQGRAGAVDGCDWTQALQSGRHPVANVSNFL